ncbi:MAG: ribosome small subunit-dependent GTPase A [Spirochaetales bacterium]|nr:ribosome small subunit-dependent GTPase A [Spirochaetales bacterium]
MEGIVYTGINNIYTVKEERSGEIFQCRIKGKVLRGEDGEFIRNVYNPLAPGDRVVFEEDPNHPGQGMISLRHERKNWFCRLNQKRRSPQYIAANLDLVLCFTSVKNPPFRPRFLDRVLIAAELGGVKAAVVVNKTDLGIEAETEERLSHYRSMGLDIFLCSAATGVGLEELNRFVGTSRVAVFGQSGVGKSTLLNALEPGIGLKTSELSDKYDRGKHTTNYSLMIDRAQGGQIIDTPGIRQLFLWGLEKEELGHYFSEMEPYWRDCRFSGCTHRNEPGCRVREAVEEGTIHRDRYESYLRLYEDLV